MEDSGFSYNGATPDDPTQKKYYLTCKLKFFEKDIRDDQGKTIVNAHRKMAILIPQESDQRTQFLTAWLPEVQTEYFELVGFISHPVDSPCRLSIHRGPDEKSERHYLFVMSKGVEDVLVRMKVESILNVTILPERDDEEADNMLDSGVATEITHEEHRT